MSEQLAFAIIGGSGIYSMPGLSDTHEQLVDTPFGKPSSPIITGVLAGRRIAFLARHGVGHFITPSEVNYRANIYALKMIGATRIISISACGSLREDYAPGDVVIPDQIYDNTRDRARTFFGGGLVAHVGVAEPFCPSLSQQVFKAVKGAGATSHMGGALITIEGPRFSTKAESNVFRTWGMSIIGMTASPEAFLAREAEMCYCTMAHVTDYDVWHVSSEPVTMDMVIHTLNKNTSVAQESLRLLVKSIEETAPCSCGNALSDALITNPAVIPAATRQKLDLLVRKYLK
jgi:5'-methylthioadenosine phosphorylase